MRSLSKIRAFLFRFWWARFGQLAEDLPRRFLAGAYAVATAEQAIAVLQQQIDAYRDLSSSLAFDQLGGAGKGSQLNRSA